MSEEKYHVDLSNARIEGLQVGDGNKQWIGRAPEKGNNDTELPTGESAEMDFPALLNHYMQMKFGDDGTAGRVLKLVYKEFALNNSDLPRQTVGNWLKKNGPKQANEWWKVGVLASVLCDEEEDVDRLLESAGHVSITTKRSQRERGMIASDALADRIEEEVLTYWMDHSFEGLMSS